MVIINNFEQGSEEWHSYRLGRITASNCADLITHKDLRKSQYLYNKAAERVTKSAADSEKHCSYHMQRGQMYESVARLKYEELALKTVQQVGIVLLNDYVACSPDGLVDDDGLIEIKVPDSNNFFKNILEIESEGVSAISKKHYMQMQFCMYVCKRNWCDYVLYSANHEVTNKALYVQRVRRDATTQIQIERVLRESIIIIDELVKKYENIKG